MQHTLIINDPKGTEILKVQIDRIDPKKAVLVVLEALQSAEPKRAKRKDAGKPRAPRLPQPETQAESAPE